MTYVRLSLMSGAVMFLPFVRCGMPWTRLQKMLVAAIILLACACASEAISKALGPEYPDSLPDVDPQQLIIGQSYAAPPSID